MAFYGVWVVDEIKCVYNFILIKIIYNILKRKLKNIEMGGENEN